MKKIQFNTKLKKLNKKDVEKKFEQIKKENNKMQSRNDIPFSALKFRVGSK